MTTVPSPCICNRLLGDIGSLRGYLLLQGMRGIGGELAVRVDGLAMLIACP
jgi:hypothetical protein